MDHFQLLSDESNPIFGYEDLKRYSQLFDLQCLIRATDERLRSIIYKQRKYPLTIEDIDVIIDEMARHCTFHEEFQQLPNVPCVATTREARNEIQNKKLAEIDDDLIVEIPAINTKTNHSGIQVPLRSSDDLSTMNSKMSLENHLKLYRNQLIMTSCITHNPRIARGRVGTLVDFIYQDENLISIKCRFENRMVYVRHHR